MRWRAILGALLLALATTGHTTAQEEALILHVANSPIEIAFEFDSSPVRAAFEVTVENRSTAAGEPRFELVLEGLDPLRAQDRPPRAEEESLTFFLAAPTVAMEPGDMAQVRLGLHHGNDASEEGRAGYLVATLITAEGEPSVRSAFVPILLSADESTSGLGGARPEPKSVTLIGTRALPFGLFDSVWVGKPSYEVTLPGWDANVTETSNELRRTVMSSDTGGRLELALDDSGTATEPRTANVTLLRANTTGKYSGDLVLDPEADESDAIEVTVNVQDLIVWPMLAVLIGTFLAWRLVVWRDQTRPREVLRARLKDAQKKYREAYSKTVPKLPSHLRLDKIFPTGDWAPQCPPALGAPIGDRLYCEIGSAKTKEKLDEVAADADRVIRTAAAWPAMRDAARKLRHKTDRYADLLPGAAIIVAAKELLADELPTDPDKLIEQTFQVSKHADAIDLWVRLVALTRQMVELYQSLDDLGGEIPPVLRQEIQRRHPAGLLDGYLSTSRSADELSDQEVLQRVTESLAFLSALHAVYVEGRDEQVRYLIAPAEMSLRSIASSVNALAAEMISPPDRRTAEEIRTEIRWHDWKEFAASFLVTVLAVVVALYVDKNFGSPWQYLSALLAGAGGQVAVSWVLLPWYRSYAPPPQVKPA